MELSTMIKDLCMADGVSGDERNALGVIAARLEGQDYYIDPLGSLICNIIPPKAGGAHLMLEAHIDEIGLVVTYIDDAGFVKVSNCGGVDRRILRSAVVTVLGKEHVAGVVCSTSPHLLKGEKTKAQQIDEVLIDVGLSAGHAKELISPGDRVVMRCEPKELLGGRLTAKALDNRAGCAAVLRAAELIKQAGAPVGVTVAFCPMEETGGAGAVTAAYNISPTHAVAVDVSYAYAPDHPRHKCGDLGGGPMIGAAPILDRELFEALKAAAKREAIPFQLEIMGSSTGTDADHIAVSRGGVKTGLVSVPLKYMHTQSEVIAVDDVENTARLLAELAKGGLAF